MDTDVGMRYWTQSSTSFISPPCPYPKRRLISQLPVPLSAFVPEQAAIQRPPSQLLGLTAWCRPTLIPFSFPEISKCSQLDLCFADILQATARASRSTRRRDDGLSVQSGLETGYLVTPLVFLDRLTMTKGSETG